MKRTIMRRKLLYLNNENNITTIIMHAYRYFLHNAIINKIIKNHTIKNENIIQIFKAEEL
jgi:hypothetical protein